MITNRCQVCDGPIVNGRCKLCGMPYRNDEILYHLNENRSEHYTHATTKARELLRERQVPLGDKQPERNPGTSGRKAGAGKNTGAAKNTAGRKQTGTGSSTSAYRTGSYGRNSSVRPATYGQTVTGRGASGKGTSYSGTNKSENAKKKTPLVSIIITIVIVLCALLPTAVDYVKENYAHQLEAVFHKKTTEDMTAYRLLAESGEDLVGDWLPAGKYILVIEGGYATVEVKSGDDVSRYSLSDQNNELSAELHKGDLVSLHNVDKVERYVDLYLERESDK